MASGGLMKAMRSFKKPATAAPARTMRPAAQRATTPPPGENQLDRMSGWDKFVYGQNQGGQDSWAADQAQAAADKKRWEESNADRIAAQKEEDKKRGDNASSMPGDIATADDALAAYERENNLKPGTYSSGGQTTDQYSSNAALKNFERLFKLPAGSVAAEGTTEVPQTPAQQRDTWGSSLGGPQNEVKELTWDEYDALSPSQRAAVDANTMLVNAIKSDLSTGALAADSKDDVYAATVNELFGETGGSDTYAPNTVMALSQLGLADTENGDLDNYLTQSALINEQDLASIGKGEFSDTARGQQTKLFSERALTSISETLSSGYGILSGVGAADPQSTELNDLFEMLSTRGNYEQLQDNDVSEIMGMFLAENPAIDEGTLTRYFEDRLNAYDYGTAAGQTPSLGSGEPNLYITPAEFRGRYFTTGGN
ncbi:hypothetical protein SEA_HANNABELLA_38 [Microbacterium phage Hannabella]|uniref:Uncharacterized protein n=1 Tax=Microbacterium phage Arete TaxID=2713257 RepID=A0A6G8R175_9CAUD|nr:hypothetical protein HWD16_gp38 [Microbacterium phage Arete]QIN93921.1 hypothetical protein SEA_ARETE_38 [Microbacterium phage Arete]URM86431.1 hypothetical protein SEA_GSHELBY23_36 [Microbacterium phage Gshelby23]UVG34244.1 hypothetical protein SEA_HANNABELLA_38 [Microbacterium phage Hannabella]